VTPKPPPPRKTKRKLITPGDIDSLFAKPAAPGAQQRDEEEEEEDDDDDDNEDDDDYVNDEAEDDNDGEDGNDEMSGTVTEGILLDGLLDRQQPPSLNLDANSTPKQSQALTRGGFLPDDGTVPDWLLAVEKEKREAKQAAKRAKKNKKLTSDWRFWAGIVVFAGFASAVWSVYQQTGGTFDSMGGNGGAELII